jgi:membrane associated rhomboid family serine protease
VAGSSKAPSGGAGAVAKRALRAEIRAQVVVLGGTLALLWLIELVNLIAFNGRLTELGIRPRTLRGLIGIPLSSFLHAGLPHLAANSVGIWFAGWFVVNRSRRDYFLVWLCATLVGGVGVWLVAPGDSVTVGASDVVMGLMGFLIARGLFERRFFPILGSIVMALVWGGGILRGLFPEDPHISWQVHLFGLAGGILAARLARARR